MKRIAPLAIPLLALASLHIYLNGFFRHFVSYAPTIPAEVVAAAHDRGFIEIVCGTIGIALSAALAAMLYSRHRIISVITLTLIALVLVGGLTFFVRA